MNELIPYDQHILESDQFESGDWDKKKVPDHMLLIPSSPEHGRIHCEIIESWLTSLGLRGITGDETSHLYHQRIVGIEAWIINCEYRTYTRIDDFELRLSREVIQAFHPKEIYEAFTNRHGEIQGKKFGI